MEIINISANLFFVLFWNAFGAIGQWAGAIASGAAVWWAVYQTRSYTVPRVKTAFDILSTKPSGDILIVYAINSGQRKILFTFAGIRWAGDSEYLLWRVYQNPDKQPVDSYDNARFMVQVRDLQIKCLKAGYTGIKELVFDFKDTQHKVYTGRFRFNIETLEVIGANKTKFQDD